MAQDGKGGERDGNLDDDRADRQEPDFALGLCVHRLGWNGSAGSRRYIVPAFPVRVELIWTGFFAKLCRQNQTDPLPKGAKVEEMTEQEELIQNIRERLGELPKEALPFDLLAFATTIGERSSMTQNEIIRLVMKEAEALDVNYLIGSSSR